jgi:acyl carrier protein
MEKSEFLLLLDELLELEPGRLTGSETLDSLEGWNSLAVISFMALVDEHLNISLEPQQIAGCLTIADLVGLLSGRIGIGGARA